MKKPKLICLLLFAAVIAVSCSRDREPETMIVPYDSSLDATGRAFMSLVEARPDWEREWREICEAGTPLPNEVVYTSFLSAPTDIRAVLPVVTDGKITRFVFFPLGRSTSETRNSDAPALGDPEIMDEKAVNESYFARAFVNSSTIGRWEEKGYSTSTKLTSHEVQHINEQQTRSTIEVMTHPFDVGIHYEYYYPIYGGGGLDLFDRLDDIAGEMRIWVIGLSGPDYYISAHVIYGHTTHRWNRL